MKNLLTIELKISAGTNWNGRQQRDMRESMAHVRRYLERVGFTGHWLLRHRLQTKQMGRRPLTFVGVRNHAIRVRGKPGGNDSVHEYDLVPPTSYDVDTSYETLRILWEKDIGRNETIQCRRAAERQFNHERNLVETESSSEAQQPANDQPAQPPEEPQLNQPAAITQHTTKINPVVPAAPQGDIIKGFQYLLDSAKRAEGRRQRIEALTQRERDLRAEMDDLQSQLREIEAEQLTLMAEDDADGSADARAVLDALQRLAAKAG